MKREEVLLIVSFIFVEAMAAYVFRIPEGIDVKAEAKYEYDLEKMPKPNQEVSAILDKIRDRFNKLRGNEDE